MVWLSEHYIELFGVITSLIYLYFSVRQSLWLWPFGILSSGLFIIVFFTTGFYADMGLQIYYLLISFYGWYYWRSGHGNDEIRQREVSRLTVRISLILSLMFILLLFFIFMILKNFTDSDVPWGDAFTTAGSIIATWLLARKVLEHWLLWIVIDSVAAILYYQKDMYPTLSLYIIYAIIAIIGYNRWKRGMKHVVS